MAQHPDTCWQQHCQGDGDNASPNKTIHERRRVSVPLLHTYTTGVRQSHRVLTSPGTSNSPRDGLEAAQNAEALFHNYLRAFHSFDPSSGLLSDEEASCVTVQIKEGDLILVHSIHANGWADGTLLSTGERGWLPTNYCEAYDDPHIRNLLNAMTQLWDLLGQNEESSFSTFVRQDYIRGLIAGVRYLLENTGCLHRDATLVVGYPGMRRMRKGLLADLSSMVQKAKELQEEASQPYAGEVVHILLDELMSRACCVVTRAVSFLDVWQREAAHTAIDAGNLPESTTSTSADVSSNQTDLKQASTPAIPRSQASAECSVEKFPSSSHLPSAQGQDVVQRQKSSSSQLVSLRNGAASHRLSLIEHDSRHSEMASEQLAQAHDVCVGHIGRLLGHHLQSRSRQELHETTQELVDACKRLLTIVNGINPMGFPLSSSIKESQSTFRTQMDELVRSTAEMFSHPDASNDGFLLTPSQVNCTVAIGTRLIRAVGECVANSRRMLEKTGDFELHSQRMIFELPGSDVPEAMIGSQGHHSNGPKDATEASLTKRLSAKTLPPLPPCLTRRAIGSADQQMRLLAKSAAVSSPDTTAGATSLDSSSTTPLQQMMLSSRSPVFHGPVLEPLRSPTSVWSDGAGSARKDSVGSTCFTEASGTRANHFRDSETTAVSEASTRATTPDKQEPHNAVCVDAALLNSFGSVSSIKSIATDISNEGNVSLLHKSYAHELILNQQGHVTGGSLEALVEQLTTHDAAPDPLFATAFYQTFRSFATPRKLAQTLVDRFDYIGDSKSVGRPVRLRICNFFKGWLETYWNAEADKEALGEIRYFVLHKLKATLPSAADRMLELIRRVTAAYQSGTTMVPLVSGIGKTATSMEAQDAGDAIPEPLISRSMLNMMRQTPKCDSGDCLILELDPTEIARQLTLLISKVYCDIQPQELLSLEWNKKGSSMAQNVRNVSRLNTDLAHVVGDTILSPEEAKKRALIIKHWVKVAMRCADLRNYESLMAIVASLGSSMVQRLRRTWELVSKKTISRFEEVKAIVDVSQNYASLRKRMDDAPAPCLPFLGVYLQDLTFIDAGNPSTRQIPGTVVDEQQTGVVVNFDKYARMARIVAQIQRFQVPYRLQSVPELQTWLERYLQRMREANGEIISTFHRRSLILEPRRHEAPKIPRIPMFSDNHTDDRARTAGAALCSEEAEATMTARPGMLSKSSTFSFKSTLARYDLPGQVIPPLSTTPKPRKSGTMRSPRKDVQ